MRSVFIIVVILWLCTRIVTAFQIANESNIDNLTSMAMNNNGNQDNQTIDGFAAIAINHMGHHSGLVESSRDPVRGIIFRQKIKPEPRSFFGLIIIPCKWKVVGNYFMRFK